MKPSELVLWLGACVLAQVCVGLFGVFSRSLQTNAMEPIPALRLLFLVSLMALAFLPVIDVASLAVKSANSAWQRHACRPGASSRDSGSKQDAPDLEAQSTMKEEPSDTTADCEGSSQGDPSSTTAGASPQRSEQLDAVAGHDPGQQQGAGLEGGSYKESQTPGRLEVETIPFQQELEQRVEQQLDGSQLARPDIAGLRRGLSRKLAGFEARHPKAHRLLAAAAITLSTGLAAAFQLMAPGFVDAALVQLIGSFGVLVVVIAQGVLMGHKLPWLVWPCSAAMTGGAAMVIVPSVGQSKSGGLDSSRAWLGFGMSVVAMLSASAFYILLQAYRRLAFTGRQLQYYYLTASVIIALPLTLAVDGTDWQSQFAGWDGGNWAMLVSASTVLYVAQLYLLQHTTWKLGAPVCSMFYGLRLVASIIESKAILDYTVITTGVQIAGAVITVASVTVYMAYQWLLSRRQAAADMTQAAAAEGGGAAAGPSESAGTG